MNTNSHDVLSAHRTRTNIRPDAVRVATLADQAPVVTVPERAVAAFDTSGIDEGLTLQGSEGVGVAA